MTTAAPDPDDESGDDQAELRVREAERADLLAVFHIEQESFPQPWPFSAFERFLDEPGFLVAQLPEEESDRDPATVGDDGRVVGFIVADTVPNHGEPLGHVKDVAVAPECRGEGVGTRLLQRALTVLASTGVSRAKLEVRETNDTARSLYERFGFSHHHTVPRYYDNGEDAHVMIREF